MSDWAAGYTTDVGYTYGYYGELNPLRARLALLSAGLAAPKFDAACELGFGQGLSANIHSAASATQWYGTDFNPAHAGFAIELAEASGAGAKLFEDAFADFAERRDLPDFDFIGLHGIWTWISDANRSIIVDFVRRKLTPGGVLYISYNTLPGWAALTPIRHLLAEHAALAGAKGQGIVPRADAALAFAEKLLEANPAYARANPQVAERLKQIKEQNRNYLAHEYFNRDWLPMHFGTMAQWLAPAKVSYACSAHYPDHIDAINLTGDQQAFMAGIPDPLLRETVRDYMINQQFRRDYWVKGARRLSVLEQAEAMRAQAVILTSPRRDVPLKVKAALGEANLLEAIYTPILDVLADHKPRTIGRIAEAVASHGVAPNQVFQAAFLLAGAGQVALMQDEATIGKAAKQTDKLNAYLLDKARGSSDLSFLASPVIGGGMFVGRIPQLFALARSQGRKQPADWVDFVWNTLKAQGQRLIKDGKMLETDDENLAELKAQADTFADAQLPILRALQIA